LAQFNLIETYYGLDPAEYNNLFDAEMEKVIERVRDPAHREALERMRGFRWMSYIAASVRNAGWRDQREVQDRAHDLAVRLLMGTLFRGFDERTSGPMDLRFKRSVANAIKNMVELERNRRRLLPSMPLDQAAEPASVSTPDDDERLVNRFRELVRKQLGGLGVAVLQVRLDGGEVKSLVDCPSLGSPGKWVIKRVVGEIKVLAREYAESLGNPAFLRDIERAMAAESETIEKRRASLTARRTVRA